MKEKLQTRVFLKLTSSISAIALIITMLSCAAPIAIAETAPEVWDGNKDVSNVTYAGGTGIESDPYLISNGAQLYKMVSENTTLDDNILHFKLTNDIYLNDVVDQDITDVDASARKTWYYTTSGTSYQFAESFDGANYTIYGLYVNGGNRGGLFPQIAKATIKNVHISKSHIASTGRPGAIAGAVWTGASNQILNCYVDSSVTVVGKDSAAGIIGYLNSAVLTVENCASLANVSVTSGSSYAGLIGATAGTNYSATLSNCWTTSSNIYKQAGTNLITATNCYSVEAYKIIGLSAMAHMPNLDWINTWEVTNSYPKLRTEAAAATTNPYWDGTAAAAYSNADGDGTVAKPYQISNAAQLFKMVSENSTSDTSQVYHFELINDIYINDVSDPDWISNNPTKWYEGTGSYYFNDTFNGNGYTIYGLYVSSTSNARGGLFPQVSDGAKISNLRIKTAYIKGTAGRSGALAGNIPSSGNKQTVIFDHCAVENTVVDDKYSAGGIVGTFQAGCKVTDCYFNGGLASSDKFTGGIAADGWSAGIEIINCYSIGAYPLSGNHATNYTCTNVYTDTATGQYTAAAVTGVTTYTDITKLQGSAAKGNTNGFNWNTVWCAEEGAFPTLYTPAQVANYWDGTTAESYAGGTGTQEDPYLIANAAQLHKLVSAGSADTNGKYFELANNIDILRIHDGWKTDNARQWNHKVIGFNSYDDSFCGYFNGNGYTVRGIYSQIATTASRAIGLFQTVGANAVIKDLKISDVYIVAYSSVENDLDLYTNYAGAVAGFAGVISADLSTPMSWPQIIGCTVTNSDISARYAGGIVGGTLGGIKIEACAYSGDVAPYTKASAETDLVSGGIIGNNADVCVIANCYTSATALAGKETGLSAIANGIVTTEDLDTNVWNITETGPVLKELNFVQVNSNNMEAGSLITIRKVLLGVSSDYITSINASAGLNVSDLVHAKVFFSNLTQIPIN